MFNQDERSADLPVSSAGSLSRTIPSSLHQLRVFLVEVSEACCIRSILATHGLSQAKQSLPFASNISSLERGTIIAIANADFHVLLQKETAIFDSGWAATDPWNSRIEEPYHAENKLMLFTLLLVTAGYYC